jgi:hypothetical protein
VTYIASIRPDLIGEGVDAGQTEVTQS